MLEKETGRFVHTYISLLMGRLSMEENKRNSETANRCYEWDWRVDWKTKRYIGKETCFIFLISPFVCF